MKRLSIELDTSIPTWLLIWFCVGLYDALCEKRNNLVDGNSVTKLHRYVNLITKLLAFSPNDKFNPFLFKTTVSWIKYMSLSRYSLEAISWIRQLLIQSNTIFDVIRRQESVNRQNKKHKIPLKNKVCECFVRETSKHSKRKLSMPAEVCDQINRMVLMGHIILEIFIVTLN